MERTGKKHTKKPFILEVTQVIVILKFKLKFEDPLPQTLDSSQTKGYRDSTKL